MRLGDVLVEAGALSREQLAEALRAQVVWGARLGTNLVELGHLSLDDLAKGLGKQHQMPAALASHFERADPELQQKLPRARAIELACIPLVMANKRAVIALLRPLAPVELALVASELGVAVDKLVPAIAGELRIRYQLEKVYGEKRDPRMVRTPGTRSDESVMFRLQPHIDPALESELAGHIELEIEDPDPAPQVHRVLGLRTLPPLEIGTSPLTSPAFDPLDRERRTYLKTLADMLADRPDQQHSVMAHIAQLQEPTGKKADPPTLTAATKWIFSSRDREQVAHRMVRAIDKFVPTALAAIFLVVRGKCAVSWTSFCRDGTALPPIAVPLDHPGLVPAVLKRKAFARSSSGDLGAVDFLLLASLGARHGELVVAPVMIDDQVICVVGIAAAHRATLDGLDAITTATGAAFARLVRDAGATA